MALPISLGRSGARSTGCHPVDVVLQSRTSKHGIGRHHPKTAAGHGRIAFLLLAIAKNGGITTPDNGPEPVSVALRQKALLPVDPRSAPAEAAVSASHQYATLQHAPPK